MSDTIRIDVTGDRQVGIRFEEFPGQLYDALRAEIDALANELFARVRAATPSLTGDLVSKERVRVFADENRITGYVDIGTEDPKRDFRKAASLEYGAHGQAKVAAHSMRLDHFWADKLAKPITVVVDAYSRPANIAEVSFLRGPLEAMAPEILTRLNGVVEKAADGANA